MLIKVRGTAILNVYLPCDTRENEYLYAYEIAKLKDKINDLMATYDIYVVGDFNAQIDKKDSYNARELKRLIKQCNLRVGDLEESQSFSHTRYNHDHTSHIDHVLTTSRNQRLHSIEIVKDDENNSDHLMLAIKTEIRVDKRGFVRKQSNQNIKLTHKWKNQSYKDRFNLIILSKQRRLQCILNEINTKIPNIEVAQSLQSKLHKELHMVLVESADEAVSIDTIKNSKRVKRNPWFNDDLVKLNRIRNEARLKYEADQSNEN